MTKPFAFGETRESRKQRRDEETRAWVELADEGETHQEIADRHGVPRTTVSGRIRQHREERADADA